MKPKEADQRMMTDHGDEGSWGRALGYASAEEHVGDNEIVCVYPGKLEVNH